MSDSRDPRGTGGIEAALRASLAEHASHAPDADPVAAQIMTSIARSERVQVRRFRQWGTWTLPVIAAGAVAAIAVALVGVSHAGRPSTHHAPAVSHSVPQPTPSVTSLPTPTGVATTVAGPPAPNGGKGFSVTDVSFVGVNHGWALGTANCFTGQGLCTELLRTTDGSTWHVLTNPPVNITQVNGCTSRCAQGIRFATDKIGYAFGPSVFFMTTDGGSHWSQQAGGADALETLDGNVIRISSACLPGCPYTVQVAPIGSAVWQPVALPGSQAGMNSGVALARTGRSAFIDIFGHVAGGASDARSVMYSSADDGATWTRRGEVCPQSAAAAEVDSVALTSAADGSVSLLCAARGGGSAFTITSTDSGQSFARGADVLGSVYPGAVLGAASASTLFVSSDVLYRSTDGGRSWQKVQRSSVGPLGATWIGFESGSVGRLVEVNAGGRPHVLWTTRNGGQTWTAHAFV